MALASFSNRSTPSAEEKKLIDFLLGRPRLKLSAYEDLEIRDTTTWGWMIQNFATSQVFSATRSLISFINSRKRT